MTVKILGGANVITPGSTVITPNSQSALPYGKLDILFCYIDEPQSTTGNHYVKALRELGHNVLTCGPYQGNINGELRSKLDIPVYDKPFYPNTYTYQEIIDKCPVQPDLIIQAEPHFFFVGSKADRRNIPAAYLTFDNHRGPLTHFEMFRKGDFDHLFVCQKYFLKPYSEALGGADKVHWLPMACDPELHKKYPDVNEECDVIIVGNTGINNSGPNWENLCKTNGIGNDDPRGDFFTTARPGVYNHEEGTPHPNTAIHESMRRFFGRTENVHDFIRWHDGIPDMLRNNAPNSKYANWDNHSHEYIERAEYLMRISRDFHLRIYSTVIGENYSRAICEGRIAFNCGLRNDVNMRVFEVMGCGVMLLTDEIPEQNECGFIDGVHYRTFRKYYPADNVNFELDYAEVRAIIRHYLNHPDERAQIAKQGQQYVYQHHTYQHRCREILNILFGGEKRK